MRGREEQIAPFGAFPAAPVMTAKDVSQSPRFLSCRMLVEFEYPGAGTVKAMGSPVKLGADCSPAMSRPPRLGEHTENVLAGLTPSEIDALRASGTIA